MVKKKPAQTASGVAAGVAGVGPTSHTRCTALWSLHSFLRALTLPLQQAEQAFTIPGLQMRNLRFRIVTRGPLIIKHFMDAPDRDMRWLAKWPEMTITGPAGSQHHWSER